MRRRYLIVPVFAIALLWMAISATGAWSELRSRGESTPGINEWHWPAGTEYHGGYLGWLEYSVGYKEYHLGRDFRAPVGTPAFAIASGTVVRIERDVYGSKSSSGSAILILHHTRAGQPFVALYGHVTDIEVVEGQQITAGQQLARLNDYEPSHLHFAIHPGANRADEDIWRGYTPQPGYTYGFVDPMAFLYENRPLNADESAYSSSAALRLDRLR